MGKRLPTWLRRSLLLIATIVVVLIGGIMLAFLLARADPDFYRPLHLTDAQRAAAARSAEEKFIRLQNSAARISAAVRAALRANAAGVATSPPTSNQTLQTITFTDSELNSFFEKWSRFQDLKSRYSQYMDDPTIVLQDEKLILATKLKEPQLVISLHFQPHIDENGQLRMDLLRVLGGRLPLPRGMISGYQDQLIAQLQKRIPSWQSSAGLTNDGAANANAICLALARFCIHALRGEPSEPVLFLPILGERGCVPVTITDIKIVDQSITLSVQPMTHEEQTSLIARLRADDQTLARTQ